MDRPVTSKARGVCKYYTESRGCYAGDSCKFLHGDTKLSPYDQSKKCRFYAKGFCKKGKHCWFKHVDPPNELPKDEEEETCCICFEKPLTFGLLSGCSHVFCLECIRQWRDPNGKQADVVFSGNTKKCPMCRASSKFITPSSRFYPTDDPQRERTTLAYKESMGRVSCKYYQDSISSPSGTPFCPFGKDCFYQHKNKDGTSYIFNDGVDKYMPVHQARQSDYTFTFNLASLLEFATGADDLVGPDIADRSGQSLDEVMEGADGAQNRRDVNDARHDRSTTVLQAVEAIRAGLERIAGQRLVAGAVGQAEEHPPGFGWLSQIPDPGRVIDRLETLVGPFDDRNHWVSTQVLDRRGRSVIVCVGGTVLPHH
ncbi:hypothetical protein BDN72DRAFT_793526 [Pluteus cervinus]|uniref:Uncharacterized protein n=1 Tax=Pluteus cervinus TaxID=181527 RepID=A0ACD3B0I8_9AGAR|nr:hypothetical protein BDN72DRAFT_793526 [Pluteus cervinus]